MKTLRALLVAAPLALSCKSSAPYTVVSAALNTAAAIGVATATRASGGCYAVCTHGTWCNPKTGFCERDAPPPCAAGDTACAAAFATPLSVERPGQSGESPSPAFGLSPETGRAPPAAVSPMQEGAAGGPRP